MGKIQGLFRLLRFELPFAAGVCVVMGQVLALGRFASIAEIALGFFSVFCISASILVLNDYFDVETDRVNAPQRPLPSGAVTSAEALGLSIVLLVGGLFLSSLLGVFALLCAVALSIVGFLYNRRFKKSGLPGNLLVSFSVGMTFIYGGLSVGLPWHETVWLFGGIAALIDLGEEIAADAMDVQGDRLIRSNSLAIRYGRRTALRISSGIFLLAVLLTLVPFVLGWFSLLYLLPILALALAIVYPALRLLGASDDRAGRRYIRWIYLGATGGLLVFLLLRLLGA